LIDGVTGVEDVGARNVARGCCQGAIEIDPPFEPRGVCTGFAAGKSYAQDIRRTGQAQEVHSLDAMTWPAWNSVFSPVLVTRRGSGAHPSSVEHLAGRVGVTGVMGGLLDQMEQDPAKVDGPIEPEEDVRRS